MNDIWNAQLFRIQETPINFIKIFAFLLALIFSYVAAQLVKHGIKKAFLLKRHLSTASCYAVSRLGYFFVLTLGLYIALTMVGVDLTGIAVVAGALSVGVGFGLQAIFSNFVAGILILFEKTIAPGDVIQLESGEVGMVIKIRIRSTIIMTSNQRKIVVPNIEMISKRLTNFTHDQKQQYPVCFTFMTKRAEDKKKVKTLALRAAYHSLTYEPSETPRVHLTKLSENFQEWKMTVWVNGRKKSTVHCPFFKLMEAMEEMFSSEGIHLEAIFYPNAFAFS